LDDLIFRGHSSIKSCKESSDSTKKKLIYQIPFKDVELIANLLQDLEQYYGDRCRVDIEMNDLEDAYINIAKEEEKILLKQRQSFRRASVANK
jgi:heme oxygenase